MNNLKKIEIHEDELKIAKIPYETARKVLRSKLILKNEMSSKLPCPETAEENDLITATTEIIHDHVEKLINTNPKNGILPIVDIEVDLNSPTVEFPSVPVARLGAEFTSRVFNPRSMVRFSRLKSNHGSNDYECNEISERIDPNKEIIIKAKENCTGEKQMKVLQSTAMGNMVTNHVMGDTCAMRDLLLWVSLTLDDRE